MSRTVIVSLILYLIFSSSLVQTLSLNRKHKNRRLNSKTQKTRKIQTGNNKKISTNFFLSTGIAFIMIIKLVTVGLNIITGILNFFIGREELKIRGMQSQTISEAVAFNQDTYEEKRTLCVATTSSSSFYIEFYDWMRIENSFKRFTTHNLFVSNKLENFDFHKHYMGKGCNGQASDPRCLSIYKRIENYDNFERLMAQAKYHLYEGVDHICKISSDVVGEVSYFKGRSGGILAAMNPKPSNFKKNIDRFLSVLNVIFTIIGALQAVGSEVDSKLSTANESLNNFQERFKNYVNTKGYEESYQKLNKTLNEQLLASPSNAYDDAFSFYIKKDVQGDPNAYTLFNVLTILGGNPFGDVALNLVIKFGEFKKDIGVLINWSSNTPYKRAISILNIVLYIFPLAFYVFHIFILGLSPGSDFMTKFYGLFPLHTFFTNGLKLVIALLNVANVEYLMKNVEESRPNIMNENDGVYEDLKRQLETAKSNRKSAAWLSFFSFVMVFLPSGMYALIWQIIKKYSNPKKLITTILKNVFNQIMVVMTIINFVLAVINLVVAIIKLVLAVIHRKRLANEVEIDRTIRDNFKKHLKLQSVYTYIRFNSIVMKTIQNCIEYIHAEMNIWTAYLSSVENTRKKSISIKNSEEENVDDLDDLNPTVKEIKPFEIHHTKFKKGAVKIKVEQVQPKNPDSDDEIEFDESFLHYEPKSKLSSPEKEVLERLENLTMEQFFLNICTENPNLCMKFWKFISFKITNEEELWKRINYILVFGPIVSPMIIEKQVFATIQPLIDNYGHRIYKPEAFDSDKLIVYQKSFYSIQFLAEIKIATRKKFPQIEESQEENVFSIQTDMSENGLYKVEYAVFKENKEIQLEELNVKDFIFFKFDDIRDDVELWNINAFNPLIVKIRPNETPRPSCIGMFSFTGLHKDPTGKELQNVQGVKFYPTLIRWSESLGSKWYSLLDPTSFGGEFKDSCSNLQSTCSSCQEIEFFTDQCTKPSLKKETKELWFCVNPGKDPINFAPLRIYYDSNQAVCSKTITIIPFKILSRNYWDYLIRENSSPLSKEKKFSKIEKTGTDIDILNVQADYLEKIKESLVFKSCELYSTLDEYKVADTTQDLNKQLHICFPNPFDFQNFYILMQDNVISKEFYENTRDLLIGKKMITLQNHLPFNSEKTLKKELMSIRTFKKHFDSTLKSLCQKDYKQYLNWTGTGLLYHHPIIPNEKGKSSDETLTSLKGKDLFNIGNGNKCFNTHVLKNYFRVLIPLKKEDEKNNLYFILFKQLTKTIDEKSTESYLYELIEKDTFLNQEDEKEDSKPIEELEDYDLKKARFGTNKNKGVSHDRKIIGNSKKVSFSIKNNPKALKQFKNPNSKISFPQNEKNGAAKEKGREKLKIFSDLSVSESPQTGFELKRMDSWYPSDFDKVFQEFSKKDEIKDANQRSLNFAPLYKFFYLELWINKQQSNDSTDLMYIDNEQIKTLINNCFIPFWPKTLRESFGQTEEEIKTEFQNFPDAEPTSALYMTFYYNKGVIYTDSISARLWVKFDYTYALSQKQLEEENEIKCDIVLKKYKNAYERALNDDDESDLSHSDDELNGSISSISLDSKVSKPQDLKPKIQSTNLKGKVNYISNKFTEKHKQKKLLKSKKLVQKKVN